MELFTKGDMVFGLLLIAALTFIFAKEAEERDTKMQQNIDAIKKRLEIEDKEDA